MRTRCRLLTIKPQRRSKIQQRQLGERGFVRPISIDRFLNTILYNIIQTQDVFLTRFQPKYSECDINIDEFKKYADIQKKVLRILNESNTGKELEQIDGRTYIYFRVLELTKEKSINLFLLDKKNNLFQNSQNNNTNPTSNTIKTQIISNISEVERYYFEKKYLVMLRNADEDTTTDSIEERQESLRLALEKYPICDLSNRSIVDDYSSDSVF